MPGPRAMASRDTGHRRRGLFSSHTGAPGQGPSTKGGTAQGPRHVPSGPPDAARGHGSSGDAPGSKPQGRPRTGSELRLVKVKGSVSTSLSDP